MADDKDKKIYSYRPNIEYQDTYESEHSEKQYKSVDASNTDSEDFSKEIIDSITDSFNETTKAVQLLPAKLQTAVNGVYKPILDAWNSMGDISYPKVIPDPYEPIYYYPDDTPDDITPEVQPVDPTSPEWPESTPGIISTSDYIIDNNAIWDPDVPMLVKFDPVRPEDIIEREYIKNVADLFSFYVNRLKDILYHYCAEKISALYGKKMGENGNPVPKNKDDIAFLVSPITNTCKDIEEQSKHLFDASVAMSEHNKLKLNFMENAFPVDQTLLHLKNFNTIYQLRLRYAKIQMEEERNKINAMNNNILKGMQASYDQKYDVAYTNLYKYMNSSLDILEDVTNTELAGLKARRTLVEKGGINK